MCHYRLPSQRSLQILHPSKAIYRLPSLFLNNLLLSNTCDRSLARLDSYTKKAFLQLNFHNNLLYFQIPTCDKVRPIYKEIKNSLGNFCIKGTLSTHLSSQNLISSPSPTSHLPLSSKALPYSSRFQTFLMSLHHIDSLQFWTWDLKPLHPPYLESRISFHKLLFSDLSLQIHFPKRAKSNFLTSITPKPPLSFNSQTLSHATYAIFLFSEPQSYKKLFYIFFTSFTIVADIQKKI